MECGFVDVRLFLCVVFVLNGAAAGAEVVPVPSMGDSISEGTVVEWLKGSKSKLLGVVTG